MIIEDVMAADVSTVAPDAAGHEPARPIGDAARAAVSRGDGKYSQAMSYAA